MATITLKGKPKPPAKTATGERRAPLRGKGVSKPRPTLAQAQAERAERAERFEKAQSERQARDERPMWDERPERPKPAGFKPAGFKPERPAPLRGDAPPRPERGPRPETRPARDTAFAPRPTRHAPPTPTPNPEAGERLSKRMSELKLASRREADEWIAAGLVRVDGQVAVLGQRVGPDARIEIDPAARQLQAQLVTVLLHKPIGYVSGQAEDGYEPASVLFTAENRWGEDPSGVAMNIGQRRGLAPAGRLDIDSTGLLVLTQDGRIARALIGEDSDVEKEYLVRVEFIGRPGGEPVPEGTEPMHALPPQDLALLNHGLELDGEALRPAKVSWQNEQQLRFVLREGKKRQIRRMCELVGLKVVGLKRVRIGRIPLGHLPVGQWRFLAPWEKF